MLAKTLSNPAKIILIHEDWVHADELRRMASAHGCDVYSYGAHAGDCSSPRPPLADMQLAIIKTSNTPRDVAQLHAAAPRLTIIAMGDGPKFEEVIDCIRAGATDYLYGSLHNAALGARLADHFATCGDAVNNGHSVAETDTTFGIIGRSTALARIRAVIARMQHTSVTALIQGPTGAGKEVVALALHRNSPRAGERLVALNCAALPDELIEGELFGYERGAFSGATQSYPGKLALADKGSLFLDEIGELSAAGQAKLLRALEERQCYRLGGHKPHSFDIRLIAATNRDLEAEVASGRFRSDLYYRIAVARVKLTGLAERPADIVPLARHFLAQLAAPHGGHPPELPEDVISALEGHDWPGNARELRNAMEVALLGSEAGGMVRLADLPDSIRLAAPARPAQIQSDDLPARMITPSSIAGALRRNDGNKSAAARALGCSRMTLYRHLRANPALMREAFA